GGPLPRAMGSRRQGHRRHVLRLRHADAPLRRPATGGRRMSVTPMRTAGETASGTFVPADPYPWPYDGDLRPENTALIVIDMQTDFCGVGGYVDKMGYDLSLTRAPIEPIKRTLAAVRAKGSPTKCSACCAACARPAISPS